MGLIKLILIAGVPGITIALINRYNGINVESYVLKYIPNPNSKTFIQNYFKITAFPVIKFEEYYNRYQTTKLTKSK